MKRLLVLLLLVAATAFAAASVSSRTGSALGTPDAYAKTCYAGYTHAVFSWGERCVRAGQYCKKVRNPEYHRYGFQCVNGRLKKQPGTRKGPR